MQVRTCGFPPLEDREKSMAFFSGLDFFGGGILTKEETVSFFTKFNKMKIENAMAELFMVAKNDYEASLTSVIAKACRAREKCCEWYVCYTIWCMAGQWGGIYASFFSF